MPKTTKTDTSLDPVIKEQVENAIKATEDVVVVKIATLLRKELDSTKELLSPGTPPHQISDKAKADFAKFINIHVSQAQKNVLHELMKNPLFEKVINQVASRVGMQFTKTISPAIVAILAKSTSPNDVIAFFQIQSIDDTHILIDQLNTNFTEQTLAKLFG